MGATMAGTETDREHRRPAKGLEEVAQALFSNLKSAEIKLLRAAQQGQTAFCGPSEESDDPRNDPMKGDAKWARNRGIRAELIRWIATSPEATSRVDPRGISIHAAWISGSLDLSYATVRFPLRLANCRLGDDLFLTQTKLPVLSLSGCAVESISARGMNVEGELSIDDSFTSAKSVDLLGARIGGYLGCGGGTFRSQGDDAFNADQIEVKGGMFLNAGFRAEGTVRLNDAKIGGDLDCDGGKFKNPGPGNKAIFADGIEVRGSVFFRGGFVAEGEVKLIGAEIGGSLECDDGKFKNPGPGNKAIFVDGIEVRGSVFLRGGFVAEGEVKLIGAKIGGSLECDGGTFKNPGPGNRAIFADGIGVQGSIFLRDGFAAEGEVKLIGAKIGGSLECERGIFNNQGAERALSADRIEVKGDVHFSEGFQGKGPIVLLGARIGLDLACINASFESVDLEKASVGGAFMWLNIQNAQTANLDLDDVSVGSLYDDESSWPSAGKLSVDGLTYKRISSPMDARSRLRWLSLQREFALQPYRQLARILSDGGDGEGARQVLFEMERLQRKNNDDFGTAAWDELLRRTVGYGYYPERALWPLLAMSGLGWIIYRRSYLRGAMAPKDKEAYQAFKEQGRPPSYYGNFSPLVYSVENCAPLVNLGQADHWGPDPNPTLQERPTSIVRGRFARLRKAWNAATNALDRLAESPRFLRIFVWIQILLGWLFATLFVAGVTGIVRRE
jgi:hypothetical protein